MLIFRFWEVFCCNLIGCVYFYVVFVSVIVWYWEKNLFTSFIFFSLERCMRSLFQMHKLSHFENTPLSFLDAVDQKCIQMT